MYFCGRNPGDAADYEAWLASVRAFQLDSRMISGSEVDRLIPGGAEASKGAIYTPSDGSAEPAQATVAIAVAARELGSSLHQACAVRAIERQAGRVSGVVTEKGTIKCHSVVLAGGVWFSPVPRQYRRRHAVSQRHGLGELYRADAGRARNLRRRPPLRLAQARRWRLHRLAGGCDDL